MVYAVGVLLRFPYNNMAGIESNRTYEAIDVYGLTLRPSLPFFCLAMATAALLSAFLVLKNFAALFDASRLT